MDIRKPDFFWVQWRVALEFFSVLPDWRFNIFMI